jgi:putative phage-type endonuclease
MKILNLDQATNEWHEFRSKGIGASDICVLMGETKYLTKKELFELKTGKAERKEISPFLQNMGAKTEETALKFFKDNYNIDFKPICVLSDENAILRASLDGYNKEHNLILEVKYMNAKSFNNLKENDEILKMHLYQMQYQMLITNIKNCLYFVLSSTGETIVKEVYADKKLQNELKKNALKFWNENVLKNICPENNNEISDDLANNLKKIAEIKMKIDLLKKEDAELRKEVISNVKGKKVVYDNISFYKTADSTSVDYRKACIDSQIDLDNYKKKKSGYWTLKIGK